MKIIHTVSNTDQPNAGPSYSVPALLNGQITQGGTGAVYTLDNGPPAYFPDIPRETFVRLGNRLGPIRQMAYSPSLRRELLSAKFDVIHAHGLWQLPTVYAVAAAKAAQKPSIIAPRGMLSDVALGYSPIKKAAFGKLFQNNAFKAASAFHATAESELAEIRAFGLSQPVCLISNGVDIPDLPELAKTSTTREIMTLGRIHPKKGIDVLIKAWAQIAKQSTDWSLRIIGPDENGHRLELEALVELLSVPRVTFTPPVYGTEKVQAYASADLFVLPTRSENFAMTVAESLSAATPVICTKGAPWSGLTDHGCGWWIDQGVDALASQLQQSIALPQKELAKMGQKGRKWMKRDFSWETFGGKSLDFYEWLTFGGPTPDFVDA